MRTVFIGSDHAGFRLKEFLLRKLGKTVSFRDLGTHSEESVDYPDYAQKVAKKVARKPGSLGILICGSGLGMCMAANKFKGIRAVDCWNPHTAELAREHNNANVLCMGGRLLKNSSALAITKKFLETPFSNIERHRRRVKKIDQMTDKY
ncbi:MAG: ribose 5-phosphate isomerase B [Candidatus Diapherotrites archaeon]|nr:ribose 5-phosphate isomerase B [Candidatus Diapherotrites archaeon]